MLHFLEGDLLLSRAELLAHGVAPGDDFKHGLALALRGKFPAMYKDFRHFCHEAAPKPGSLWVWQGVDLHGRPVRIAALFTQERPAREGGRPGPAHTEYVNHALHALRRWIEEQHVASVAMPAVATGVGGLDWAHVEPLVRAQLGGLPIPVAVYTRYTAGIVAPEPFPAKAQH